MGFQTVNMCALLSKSIGGASLRSCRIDAEPARKNQRAHIMRVFPGQALLADMSVSHSRSPSQITNGSGPAACQQPEQNAKYAAVASRLGAEPLNLVVDSCGGTSLGASRLIVAIAKEGVRWSANTWTESGIRRRLPGAIATAVQRGNRLAMLAGYSRAAVARVRYVDYTSAESGSASVTEGVSGEQREEEEEQ